MQKAMLLACSMAEQKDLPSASEMGKWSAERLGCLLGRRKAPLLAHELGAPLVMQMALR